MGGMQKQAEISMHFIYDHNYVVRTFVYYNDEINYIKSSLYHIRASDTINYNVS